jgi:hypothetical protein
MAFSSTIDDAKFYLIDRFPGVVKENMPYPANLTVASNNCDWRLGSKIVVRNKTNNGEAILAYLKYTKGTASAPTGAKAICGIDTSSKDAFTVCNDGGEILLEGPIAISLGAITDGQYGWFWVGGVCPVDIISGLDGNYNTDGTVAAGMGIVMSDGDSGTSGVAGFSAFVDKDTAGNASTTRGVVAGYALDADA